MPEVTIKVQCDCSSQTEILQRLDALEKGQQQMTTDIATLKDVEATEEGEITQVVALVNTQKAHIADQDVQIAALKDQIANLPLSPDDAAAVTAMIAGIQAKNAEMAAALVAVTQPVTTSPTTTPTV